MERLICVLLAVGSWVGGAALAEAKASAPFIISLSALGWLFITIAIGGRKGSAVGVGILVFAACSGLLFSMLGKMPQSSPFYTLEPDGLFFWFGIVGSVCLALIIPAMVTVKLWKRAGVTGKQVEEKKAAEKGEKNYGYKGLI